MKACQTVIYSFLIGGTLALIAQAILTVLTLLWTDTFMSFFMGGGTLIAMGIIGCFLGGFANYQIMEKWGTFGCLLPFSGFAMAVGMKMIKPWTQGESLGKSLWPGIWLVLWFNFVGAVVWILFGYILTIGGVEATPLLEKTTTNMIFPYAFLIGGFLAAIFQIVFLIVKCEPVWVLMFAWCCGALFAPIGVSSALANWAGEGFSVMIPVGGYNMYNVGVAFAQGEMTEGLVHLGSFLLAVFGLFFTGLFTFIIYNAKFGRTPITEVHRAKAQRMLDELPPAPATPNSTPADTA